MQVDLIALITQPITPFNSALNNRLGLEIIVQNHRIIQLLQKAKFKG